MRDDTAYEIAQFPLLWSFLGGTWNWLWKQRVDAVVTSQSHTLPISCLGQHSVGMQKALSLNSVTYPPILLALLLLG